MKTWHRSRGIDELIHNALTWFRSSFCAVEVREYRRPLVKTVLCLPKTYGNRTLQSTYNPHIASKRDVLHFNTARIHVGPFPNHYTHVWNLANCTHTLQLLTMTDALQTVFRRSGHQYALRDFGRTTIKKRWRKRRLPILYDFQILPC